MALTREKHPMPNELKDILVQHHLLNAYNNRPAYQKNDYIGWIGRAKRDQTRLKRINQMLAELELGNTYMKMAWGGKAQ